MPSHVLRSQLRKVFPDRSDADLETSLQYMQQFRENDRPAVLQQEPFPDDERGGHLSAMKLMPNFEMAMYLAQATGSCIVTDSAARWQEIRQTAHRRARVSGIEVPALARSIDESVFAFRQNVADIFALVDVAITYKVWGRPEVRSSISRTRAGAHSSPSTSWRRSVSISKSMIRPQNRGWFDAILSARERAELDAGRPAVSTLLRLWVRKEAIVKAIGCRFSLAADALDIGLREVDVHNWRSIEVGVNGVLRSSVLLDLPGPETAALARIGGPSAHIVHTRLYLEVA